MPGLDPTLPVGMLDSLWSRGDEAVVRAHVTDDFRYSLSASGESLDLEGYLALIRSFRQAFRPIDLLFHKVLVEGERVAVHYSITGAHVADIFGIPASDRPRWIEAMTMMHFRDGRLARQISITDFLSLRRQLESRE